MLSVFVPQGTSLQRQAIEGEVALPEAAVWIDLVGPTQSEDKLVERFLGTAVPTREEMQEIEVSSRLYVENGARYMTATLMCQSETDTPRTTPVTFILAGTRLVTVRYDDPKPFSLITNKFGRFCPSNITGQIVFLDLLDAVIDRSADILERIGIDVDQLSHDIFEPTRTAKKQGWGAHTNVMRTIGRTGDLTSKVRESLVSVGRLLLFLANEAEGMRWSKDIRAQLQSMQRDIHSLTDHSSYLTNKITFLLDALLGVVNLEQNNIIKLFSVMAVVLMPPTLIASIYGMNFDAMPELHWHLGYPLAVFLMVLTGVLPYAYFKWWKRWL
jgi:magnesium transporter